MILYNVNKLIEISLLCHHDLYFYLGTNPVCADVCTSSEAHVELDLSEPRIYRENEHVQINLHHTGSGRCREPGKIRIMFSHFCFLFTSYSNYLLKIISLQVFCIDEKL